MAPHLIPCVVPVWIGAGGLVIRRPPELAVDGARGKCVKRARVNRVRNGDQQRREQQHQAHDQHGR